MSFQKSISYKKSRHGAPGPIGTSKSNLLYVNFLYALVGKYGHCIMFGGMGIFSACRVYFKYFLTNMNVCMWSGMLLDPNALRCD